MAEVLALHETSANPSVQPESSLKPGKRSPWLRKYAWTPEKARECGIKAQKVIAERKALRKLAILQDTNQEANRIEQIRNVKAQLRKPGLTAAEYAGWMRNLRELGGLPPKIEPKEHKPATRPASIDPIV